jgi:diaminohydroxyphosphoribosylaminopyrimidine deaminase/5-amino-6-(5-phosphoribosylamino)uracil reductase
MTIDGSVAAHDGTSQWITGGLAREDAHDLRSRVDGVVVGAGTVRADNPRLDVRLDGFEGVQPRPIIVTGADVLPSDATLWQRDPVVVATSDLSVPSGEVVVVPESGGFPDPEQTCRRLADLGMLHLLLEGGPTLAGSWWRAGVISTGIVYIGSKVGAGSGRSPLAGLFATMKDALDVEFEDVRSVGGDVLIAFRKKNRS